MRKKIGCVVLMMIVSMVMLANTALAASFNITIKPNKNFDDVAVNDYIIYTITTSQDTNKFTVDITFDDDYLEFVSCETAGIETGLVDGNVNCTMVSMGNVGISEMKFKFKKKADSTNPVEIGLINCKFTPAGELDRVPEDQVSVVFEDVAKAQTGTQTGTDNGSQTGTQTQTGTENQTQAGTQTGTENQSQAGTTTGTDNGTQSGTGTQAGTTDAGKTAKEDKKEEKAVEENKKDNSQADKIIPQTGSSNVLVLATISAMAVVAGAGIAMKKNF